MKKIIKSITLVIIMAILLSDFAIFGIAPGISYAASKKIEIRKCDFIMGVSSLIKEEEYIKKFDKLAKTIGKMKRKKSKAFTSYYAAGNHITLGYNRDAGFEYKYKEAYTYVKNSGNKNVSIFGVKPGMKLSVARKKLKKYGLEEWEGWPQKNVFWAGDAANVALKVKNKKVKSVSFTLAPTG